MIFNMRNQSLIVFIKRACIVWSKWEVDSWWSYDKHCGQNCNSQKPEKSTTQQNKKKKKKREKKMYMQACKQRFACDKQKACRENCLK